MPSLCGSSTELRLGSSARYRFAVAPAAAGGVTFSFVIKCRKSLMARSYSVSLSLKSTGTSYSRPSRPITCCMTRSRSVFLCLFEVGSVSKASCSCCSFPVVEYSPSASILAARLSFVGFTGESSFFFSSSSPIRTSIGAVAGYSIYLSSSRSSSYYSLSSPRTRRPAPVAGRFCVFPAAIPAAALPSPSTSCASSMLESARLVLGCS